MMLEYLWTGYIYGAVIWFVWGVFSTAITDEYADFADDIERRYPEFSDSPWLKVGAYLGLTGGITVISLIWPYRLYRMFRKFFSGS